MKLNIKKYLSKIQKLKIYFNKIKIFGSKKIYKNCCLNIFLSCIGLVPLNTKQKRAIKFILFLIVIAFNSSCAVDNSKKMNQTDNKVICETKCQSEFAMIYLHGLDSKSPSVQELNNRMKLKKIASQLNMSLAIPRAKNSCKGKLCWGWAFNEKEIKEGITTIKESITKCHLNHKKIILIGFSNGGYFAAKLYSKNLYKKINKNIFAGISVAAAMLKGNLPPTKEKLTEKFSFIIGEQDKYNYDNKQNYYQQLKSNSKNIKLYKVMDGHVLPIKETSQSLVELIQ